MRGAELPERQPFHLPPWVIATVIQPEFRAAPVNTMAMKVKMPTASWTVLLTAIVVLPRLVAFAKP